MEQEISKKMMDSQNAQLAGPHPHLKLRRVASLAVFLGLIAVLAFGTLNISKAGPQSNAAMSLSPHQIPVPPQYFDLNIMFYPGVVSPWPAVPFYSWRVWHALWFDLEPQKGQWNWKHLDELTANNAAHNSEMMLIMSYSPMWATQKPQAPADWHAGTAGPVNMDDWRDYVRTVGQREKGKIHVWEMWNEPDRPRAWQGDIDTMVQMTAEASKILKGIDPTNVIVSPSATHPRGNAWLDAFLSKGGADYVDVIGYHFYTGNVGSMDPPEAVIPLIQNVKAILAKHNVTKPLWNTEAGWLGPQPLSDEEQAAYVARSYILNWAAGIDRFYWFQWDVHTNSQIEMVRRDNSTITPAGNAFITIQKWMTGWTLHKCLTSDNRNWVCEMNQGSTYKFIVWSTDGEKGFKLAPNWKVSTVTTLDGTVTQINGDSVSIGGRPVLIQ
jgi:hypothetical protein